MYLNFNFFYGRKIFIICISIWMDRLTKLPSYSSSKLLNVSNLFLVSIEPVQTKIWNLMIFMILFNECSTVWDNNPGSLYKESILQWKTLKLKYSKTLIDAQTSLMAQTLLKQSMTPGKSSIGRDCISFPSKLFSINIFFLHKDIPYWYIVIHIWQCCQNLEVQI